MRKLKALASNFTTLEILEHFTDLTPEGLMPQRDRLAFRNYLRTA